MLILPRDKDILRGLAGQIAEIAALPVQPEKIELWRRLNRLEPVRPLVWINEIPWHEMSPGLDLQCANPWCCGIEAHLRRLLYQWRHMPGDMTVDANLWCPLAIHDTGYGLDVRTEHTDSGPGSVRYVPVIASDKDVLKIQMPQILHDERATEDAYQTMLEIFAGVMPVRKRGYVGYWFAPWDQLIQWTGIERTMIDMIDRPAFVHRCIDRMVQAMISRLDQLQEQNLLGLNNCNLRVGAGGLGWTDELPQDDFDGRHVRPIDCWGNSTPQIFSGVSPEMHWEFALRYELRILERFGLNCYGCCEPLHHKIDILAKIPRLRRISVSPRADKAVAAQGIQGRYVFSYKPNPAVLATDVWNPRQARKELREDLAKARGCRVEIILKDITTLRGEPHRLWEWADIAMQLAQECTP